MASFQEGEYQAQANTLSGKDLAFATALRVMLGAPRESLSPLRYEEILCRYAEQGITRHSIPVIISSGRVKRPDGSVVTPEEFRALQIMVYG